MIIGWVKGGSILYATHHGLEKGIQPSSNLIEFLLK